MVLQSTRPGRDEAADRSIVLDAAERLFYERGVQAVGIDDVRSAAGVSLKRLYQLFPSKDRLVVAFLERRDTRWRARLADFVAARATAGGDPTERILAVFDWLGEWFAEPGFRGCAWINSHGELGGVSADVARLAREHKTAFRTFLAVLVAAAALPDGMTDELLLLAEGAMVTAGIFNTTTPAAQARHAAETLLLAAVRPVP
ncbi:MAG TPA: TetR/AcrR family transcriptional regulator [Acidimicrobiia bacterium]|nr:TetR/AcrR family transcriptional regulator [Acidimicrobiia bacterium]